MLRSKGIEVEEEAEEQSEVTIAMKKLEKMELPEAQKEATTYPENADIKTTLEPQPNEF